MPAPDTLTDSLTGDEKSSCYVIFFQYRFNLYLNKEMSKAVKL